VFGLMFTFTVHPDGAEPYEATATARDIVMWEKVAKGRSLGKLGDNPSMSDLYSLAHVASRRLGLYAGSLADFETGVDLEFQSAADEAADPTRPGL
jgi:hypothetical protein